MPSRLESVGEAEARRAEVVRLARSDPELSSREIARRVDCSHKRVSAIRRDLDDHEPEPEEIQTIRLRPHGAPFDRLEAAETERDALFIEVQTLREQLAAVGR